MFQALYDVARHTALHLIITPNGPQLRIIVTPKPTGEAANNAALAKPFSCTGTPEELDAEFPAALAQYTQGVNDLRAKLDLPLSDLEAAKKKAEKKEAAKAAKEKEQKDAAEKRKAAAQQAAKTRADNAAKKKAEKEAKAQARADARAAKKKPSLPGATTPAALVQAPGWPFPTGAGAPAAAERKAQQRPGLAGKPECIRDYRQMKLKHGDKLTRRLFIKKSETGRRYEKLWPNWEKFVKEAGAQAELPLETTPAQQSGDPVTAAAEPRDALAREDAPSSADAGSSTDNRPGAQTSTEEAKGEDENAPISGAASAPVASEDDPVNEETEADKLLASAVDGTIKLPADAPPPAADPKPYKVFTPEGTFIAESKYAYTLGEKLQHNGVEVTVDQVDAAGRRFTARPPRPVWKVCSPDGELLAVLDHEPTLGQRITLGEQTYAVFDVDGQECSAAPIKRKAPVETAAATQE